MNVKTEKTFLVQIDAQEAGVILALLGLVAGPQNSVGRAVTDSLQDALEKAGVVKVDAFEDEGVTAKDIPI